MFLLKEPSDEEIHRFILKQATLPFSYAEVGATAATPPAGYTADHHRVRLGHGRETYRRAIEAVRSWKMYALGWATICPKEAAIEAGTTVAVVAHHFGFYSLNATRIVYTIEEDAAVKRYGFAHGTLPGHVEIGEERFVVEWRADGDDTVCYDLSSFARGADVFIKVGYPVRRLMQKRFAADSKRAMLEAVSRA